MKVYLHPKEGRRVRAHLPHPQCDHVLVPGACPACGTSLEDDRGRTVHKVAGRAGSMVREHDRYVSTAACVGCGEVLGRLVAVVSTIFGLEEDERMTGPSRRWRVY